MTDLTSRHAPVGRFDSALAERGPTRDEVVSPLLVAHPISWDRILETLPDGIGLLDNHGVMHYVNDNLMRMTGYSRLELIGQNVKMLVPPRHSEMEGVARREHARDPKTSFVWSDLDLSVLCKDGSELSVDFAMSPLDLDGRSWVVAAIRDNRPRRALEHARAEVELRFRMAFESNMAPMSFADLDDNLIAVNEAFCQMVGYSEAELIGGDSTLFTYPEDVGVTESSHDRLVRGETDQERYVKRYLTKDGRVIHVEVLRSPARDADGTILYFVFSERDVTEERALAAQLSHQALHDPLTGLANRALFEDRLAQAQARVMRNGGFGAVLLIDLDDFKGVNDTHGHFVGDQLLKMVAGRLELVTRATDSLCRFGGDEFLYLAEGLDTREEAEVLAQRLISEIAEPFSLSGTQIELRASIGVVVWDQECSTFDETIQNADAALYEAKHHVRGHHVVFTPSMHQRAVSRFALLQELRHALQSDELSMHYQPIADLATGEVVGFEALMRWQHPERGWVPPNVFIPLAETSDLIIELGSFALQKAINEASTWERSNAAQRPYIAVNLSAHQFLDPGLVPLIKRLLNASGLPAELLVLEITESVALIDIAETLSVLEHLHQLGVGVALDDFGTGFSSLSYLAALNPRIIKIDQSFVRPAQESLRNDTLLETIISLGQKLNVTMLAEGIETKGQFARLRRLGCEQGQGYLFSPAVPTTEVEAMVGQIFEGS